MTSFPTQSCDALVTDGSPIYLTHWDGWRDIKVWCELTLISLVTGSLLPPQKTSLMGCTAPPLKRLGLSHPLSNVWLLYITHSTKKVKTGKGFHTITLPLHHLTPFFVQGIHTPRLADQVSVYSSSPTSTIIPLPAEAGKHGNPKYTLTRNR